MPVSPKTKARRKIAARKFKRNAPSRKRTPPESFNEVVTLKVNLPLEVTFYNGMPKDLDPHTFEEALARTLNEVDDGVRNHGTDAFDLVLPVIVENASRRVISKVLHERYGDRMIPSGGGLSSLVHTAATKRLKGNAPFCRCGEAVATGKVETYFSPRKEFQTEFNFY